MLEKWYTIESHNCKMSLVGECLAHSGPVQVCYRLFPFIVTMVINAVAVRRWLILLSDVILINFDELFKVTKFSHHIKFYKRGDPIGAMKMDGKLILDLA